MARKVASIPLGFFASHAYVERRGRPDSLAALAEHDIIGPDRNRSDLGLAERLGLGTARNRLVLRTDSHPAQLARGARRHRHRGRPGAGRPSGIRGWCGCWPMSTPQRSTPLS